MATIALTSARPAPHLHDTMPMRRVLGAYVAEARFETLRHLKTPAFALPFLAIPVALYLFFSNMATPGATAAADPALRVGVRMFTGFGIVGVMGPALFAFGMAVALDRDLGLLRLKRALPMPPMAYLLGKMTMAMLFSGLVMLLVIAAALAGITVLVAGLAAHRIAKTVQCVSECGRRTTARRSGVATWRPCSPDRRPLTRPPAGRR